MPSPSNFNPDQLHEHFDRIKRATGIELTDNNRMIQLPTGHKFIAGELKHFRAMDISRVTTDIPLHSEKGKLGSLHMIEDPDATFAYLDLMDDEPRGYMMTFAGEQVKPRPWQDPMPQYNPTAEFVDKQIGLLDDSRLSRDPIKNPGVVRVTESDRSSSRRARLGFNARTRRYEHIPD